MQQPKAPHPRMPRSDPSKSQRVVRPSESNEERQRREQQGQRDLDPVGERDREPRRDAREDEG